MIRNCHTFNTSHTNFRCRESMSKNKLSRTLGAGWNRDTNGVARGLVVDRGGGKRKEKRHGQKTKVTNTSQNGNRAAESCVVPAGTPGSFLAAYPASKRWALIWRPCRDGSGAIRTELTVGQRKYSSPLGLGSGRLRAPSNYREAARKTRTEPRIYTDERGSDFDLELSV
jgi:hypothetical protein